MSLYKKFVLNLKLATKRDMACLLQYGNWNIRKLIPRMLLLHAKMIKLSVTHAICTCLRSEPNTAKTRYRNQKPSIDFRKKSCTSAEISQ